MFTGIITDIGTIREREERGDMRFTLSCAYPHDDIAIGASISCSGVCLTVVDKGHSNDWGDWFCVDVSAESLSRTTLDDWAVGTKVNLERALAMSDEFGGHMVTGHVDGIGTIQSIEKHGDSTDLMLTLPDELMPFMAEKGSVCVDGVSLTINKVGKNSLNLNIIPHTLCVTTLGHAEEGDQVNLEVDLIARYVHKLLKNMKG